MERDPTVFIVDDDPATLNSLRFLVESVGLRVETFTSAQAFLESYKTDRLGCLVVDVRMPGMSGLELQEQLVAEKITIPIIVVSGHGDVPIAVRAMRSGAIDFIEKPFEDQVMIDRIQAAVNMDRDLRQRRLRRQQLDEVFARLTPREHEVMNLVVQGKPNKEVAALLSRSEKTVEFHRAQVMRKTGVDSFAELVRLFHEHAEISDEAQTESDSEVES